MENKLQENGKFHIPSAKEWLQMNPNRLESIHNGWDGTRGRGNMWSDLAMYEAMRDFAKLHVTIALKAAANNAKFDIVFDTKGEEDYLLDEDGDCNVISKSSILNAYPLTNIV